MSSILTNLGMCKEYHIPIQLTYLCKLYSLVTWKEAQDLYIECVDEVINRHKITSFVESFNDFYTSYYCNVVANKFIERLSKLNKEKVQK